MRRTSWGSLGIIALASAMVSWVVLDLASRAGLVAVPTPWFTAGFLAIVAVWLFSRGRAVRRMVAGKPALMTALGAAKVVSFAKASSITGSLLGGFFLAQLLTAARNPAAPLNQDQMVGAVIDLAASLGLVGVAMLVEHWCHVQPPDDDEHPNHPTATAA